jgi:penicillin-binding protein 2
MSREIFRVPAWRLYTLAGVFVAMLCVLAGSLAWRQLAQRTDYAERERIQNMRRILQPAPRGRILDRNGRILVENAPQWRAVLYLAELRAEFNRARREELRRLRAAGETRAENFDATVRAKVVQRYLDQINRIAGGARQVDARALDRHFHQRLLLPFPIAEGLDAAEFAALLEQIPPSSPIQLGASGRRHYPQGTLAAHVLGYVNQADVDLGDEFGEDLATFALRGSKGAAGLEQSFDDRLQGAPGGEIWMVDHQGRQYRRVESRPPRPGRDLVTSLDVDLQLAAELQLAGKTGAVVAQDVGTGEVLALASAPGYDPNLFETDRAAEMTRMNETGAWLNRATQGLYPPGSTFKILVALAGFRSGDLSISTTHTCEGVLEVGGRTFPCHGRTAHGQIGLIEAVRASCNVFFYRTGLAIGVEGIAAESRRFGLDTPTGIELPGETHRMIVPDRAWKRRALDLSWFAGDTANFSIGQGYLRVTPLQMNDFVAALARGETRTRPTLVRQEPDARKPRPTAAVSAIELPPVALAVLKDGMELAVDRGTGRLARIDGLRIAGKTGTAQVETPQGTLNMAWFIGYAPAEDPKVAVTVVIEGDEPDVEFAGGRQAAPVARKVFETWFAKQPVR